MKYVRREIRTLTDDEREELLNAVSENRNRAIFHVHGIPGSFFL